VVSWSYWSCVREKGRSFMQLCAHTAVWKTGAGGGAGPVRSRSSAGERRGDFGPFARIGEKACCCRT
jgi:hypothetical protein